MSSSEEIVRHLLRQSPSNLAARALLGRIYLKSGQLEQAEEQLLQALDMDPENVVILTSLADLLETLGKDAAKAGHSASGVRVRPDAHRR